LRRGRWIWLWPPLSGPPYDGHCRDCRPRRLHGRDDAPKLNTWKPPESVKIGLSH
jgi:hypothetical protein